MGCLVRFAFFYGRLSDFCGMSRLFCVFFVESFASGGVVCAGCLVCFAFFMKIDVLVKKCFFRDVSSVLYVFFVLSSYFFI